MNRRSFLTRSGLAIGALFVGDEVLEAFARLTHVRKSFPSAGVGLAPDYEFLRVHHSIDSAGMLTATLEGSVDNNHWRHIESKLVHGNQCRFFVAPHPPVTVTFS